VERNPVRAGLVDRAQEYPWSSAREHCGLAHDGLLSPLDPPEWLVNLPQAEVQRRWAEWLQDEDEHETATIRRNTLTGRPCGPASFVQTLEGILSRVLHPQKRGRKPKPQNSNEGPADQAPNA
jgi:putative transposase